MRKFLSFCFFLILFSSFSVNAETFDHEHGLFDIILKKHVVSVADNTSSRVDYKSLSNDRGLMKGYLLSLASVSQTEFQSWDKNMQLAFLINAYNASVLDLVVRHYPVKSFMKIGSIFRKTGSIRFVELFGKKWSLDEIEHDFIRKKGVYDEPGAYLALVSAASGGPPLKNSAYFYEKLDAQLEENIVSFLSDREKNRYDDKKNVFHVSPVFKWYEVDLTDKYGSVEQFLLLYSAHLTSDHKRISKSKIKEIAVEYGSYDWSLNDR